MLLESWPEVVSPSSQLGEGHGVHPAGPLGRRTRIRHCRRGLGVNMAVSDGNATCLAETPTSVQVSVEVGHGGGGGGRGGRWYERGRRRRGESPTPRTLPR